MQTKAEATLTISKLKLSPVYDSITITDNVGFFLMAYRAKQKK